MSKTRKTAPSWVKTANAPVHLKRVFHLPTCDGNCGFENMTAKEYKSFRKESGLFKSAKMCLVFVDGNYSYVNKLYYNGTHGKWGVKLYNRRERAKVRIELDNMKYAPEDNAPEPYRGRNRNKWDMG